jgi:glucose/mannose-6-phosphate isomerase
MEGGAGNGRGRLALDRACVADVDTTGQIGEVLDLGLHLRDALWRVDSAGLEPADAPGGLVLAGMGGSGIGARLAVAALGPRARRPLTIAAGYSLPPWTSADALVLCASYSGNTEEVLACYDAAGALGARRIASATGGELAERARADGVPVIPLPGGFQPRATVGYSTVVALEVAALCGAGPALRDEVEAAAELVGTLAAAWGPEGPDDGDAKTVARLLHGTIPVIAGGELTAPVAYRWKSQINENAKLPAFASELPELDHNELCGWEGAPERGPFAAVLLEDPGDHDRLAARHELTAGLIEQAGSRVARLRARGETALERVMSLVLLGDLVSVYLAVLRDVDPADIAVLDRLKAQLARR